MRRAPAAAAGGQATQRKVTPNTSLVKGGLNVIGEHLTDRHENITNSLLFLATTVGVDCSIEYVDRRDIDNVQRRVLNISSGLGRRAMAGSVAYCAAKAGLVMLTHSLARELAPAVRVNAIAPGFFVMRLISPPDEPRRASRPRRAAAGW